MLMQKDTRRVLLTNKRRDITNSVIQKILLILEQLPCDGKITVAELMRVYNGATKETFLKKIDGDYDVDRKWFTRLKLKNLTVTDSRTMRSYVEKIIHKTGRFSLRLSERGDLISKACVDKILNYDHAIVNQEGPRSVDFYDPDNAHVAGPVLLVSNMALAENTPRCPNSFYFSGIQAGTTVVQAATVVVRFNPSNMSNVQSQENSISFLRIEDEKE